MNASACRNFFLQPTAVLHRQYEALRAVFVEQQPLPQVAQQFGYAYGSLRNLVAAFRAYGRADHVPPFSSPRSAGDRADLAPRPNPVSRNSPPVPTAVG